jgi:hypothetical protein
MTGLHKLKQWGWDLNLRPPGYEPDERGIVARAGLFLTSPGREGYGGSSLAQFRPLLAHLLSLISRRATVGRRWRNSARAVSAHED